MVSIGQIMTLDVVDLREFYISPLGREVRFLLRRKLARIWPDMRGEVVLALGYATPLLRPWLEKAVSLFAMMPETQGVAYWPREGPNISCLANLAELPLPDESVSRSILLHALETATDPEAVLRELWRVLSPNGRVLVIVPNRRSFWAHGDHTPFGTGQPYSMSQLRAALREQGFLVERSWHALYAPPWSSRLGLFLSRWIELIAPILCPAFGGVLIVEAGKQIFSPALVKARASGRRLVVPLPFPSAPVGPLGAGRSENG